MSTVDTIAKTAEDTADAVKKEVAPSTTDKMTAKAKETFKDGKEKAEKAGQATLDAVKKHPGTAAAIAVGAAAAVAGAVFGATKLKSKDTKTAVKKPTAPKKA